MQADHAGQKGWASTTGAFGSALAALTAKYGGDEEDQKRDKKARAPRIVRSSVLRSKDTSRYSAHDMKAIMGDNDTSSSPRRKRRREENSASATDAKPKKKRVKQSSSSAKEKDDELPPKKKRTKESAASSSSGESVKPKKKRRKLYYNT